METLHPLHSTSTMEQSRFMSQVLLWLSALTLAWWYLMIQIILSGSACPTLTRMQHVVSVETSTITLKMTLGPVKERLWVLMWFLPTAGKHLVMMSQGVRHSVEVWTVLPALQIRQHYTAIMPIVVSCRAVLDLLLRVTNNFLHRPLCKVVFLICVLLEGTSPFCVKP